VTSRLGRGLRRFVDSLQRGLFDEVAVAPAASMPTGTDLAAADPSTVDRARAGPARTDPAGGAVAPHPQATREVFLDGQPIAFRLVRVRRRSIGFVVDGSGLTVRAPKWIALRDVDAAVREKRRWILASLAEQRERAARLASARVVWRDGASIAYLGRPLVIVVSGDGGLGVGTTALATAPATNDGASATNGDAAATNDDACAANGAAAPPRLLVALPRDADEARIRETVQGWLQREARRVFAERVAHFEARLGVRVKRLSLSSAATRWGSANANGAVRLHWRLIEHPLATIDYVVAHELAHLREMNHSARFWAVVRSVVPDYEQSRARLRRQGHADR
jgi:predicted metal-dependent hydrolase